MLRSSFHTCALILLFPLLSGCQLENSKPPQGEAASFADTKFEGFGLDQSENSSSSLTHWGIPQSVRYSYRACLKSLRYDDPIESHKFAIVDSEGKRWSLITDSNGCLNWQKSYSFSIRGAALYMEEIFTIKSEGIHRGQILLKAAINPRGLALKIPEISEFVDLTRGGNVSFLVPNKYMPDALAGHYPSEDSVFNQMSLHIDEQNITSTIPESGSPVTLAMTSTSQLQTYDHLKKPFLYELQKGEFIASAFLIHLYKDKNGDEQFSVLNPMGASASPFVIKNGQLTGRLALDLTSVPNEGQLVMLMKMAPGPNSILDINPLSQIYNMGDPKNFLQGNSAHLLPNKEKLIHLVEKRILELQDPKNSSSDEPIEDGKKERTRRHINKYYFDHLSLKYGGVVLEDETPTSRTVRILLEACAKDPLVFRPIRLRDFEITAKPLQTTTHVLSTSPDISKSKTVDVTTDQNGCMQWTDRLTHQYYWPQQFFVKEYIVKDLENGLTETVKAVINPWNTSWIFARDYRQVNPDDIGPPPADGPRARLFMSGYTLNSRGTDYDIDANLDLHIKKKYNLLIRPEVLRHDSQTYGSMGHEALRDGNYLLKVALVRNFSEDKFSPEMYVNSWQKIVRVKGGTVATPISFNITDLTLVGSRNRLVIEFFTIHSHKVIYQKSQTHLPEQERLVDQQQTLKQPHLIDLDSGLVINSFSGPFIPLFESQGPSMIEMVGLSATEIIEQGETYLNEVAKLNSTTTALEIFDRKYRLRSVNLLKDSDRSWLTKSSQLTEQDLEQLIPRIMKEGPSQPELEKRLSLKLCSFWTNQLLPEMLARFSTEDQAAGIERPLIQSKSLLNYYYLLYYACYRGIEQGSEFFSFDRKLIVKNIDKNSLIHKGGSSFNLNVSSDFKLDKGQGWNVRQSYSSDLSFSAGVGFEAKFAGIGVNAGANRGETFSSSEASDYSMGRSAVLSYGAGAYLVVQHSIFRFDITDYDRCLVIKPRWEMMKSIMDSPISDHIQQEDSYLSDQLWGWLPFMSSEDDEALEKERTVRSLIPEGRHLDLMDSGLRLCLSEDNLKPIQAVEDYYYVTQHFTSGDMHDPTDLKNRPWLLEIRSSRDFQVFMESILKHNKLSQVGNITNTPIHLLSDAYSRFSEHLPAWRGIYTYYNYDPYQSEHCDSRQSMTDNLLESFKQIALGPFTLKDGKGIDFWQIYYCPQERRKL